MAIAKIKYFLFLVSFFLFGMVIAQQKGDKHDVFFQKWQNSPVLKNTSIGVSVIDGETGEKLMETTPQLSLVPASVLKVVTSAAALELLGPDFTFETKLGYTGTIDSLSGTLNGDLVIVGGGDPALGSKYFQDYYSGAGFLDQWVKCIQERGIKQINGNIVADASIYEEQMIPNTWIWEDIGNYFGAGACGLSVFDNMYTIHLKSAEAGTKTEVIKIEPEIPGLQLFNEVISSDDKRDQAYVFGSPFEDKRVIRGSIPANRNDFEIKASMPNPPLLLATQVKQALVSNKISVTGEPVSSFTNVPVSEILYTVQSPKLIEITDVLNHESVNLFTEHLCKHLAYLSSGKGTTKDGIKRILQFWKEKGIDTDGMSMADGSGLSRFNFITSAQLTEILKYIKQGSLYSAFKESLPTAGVNGTLVVFSSEKFPDGCLRAKSGSMTRVRCYTGFLKTIHDKELLFAVMLNNFSCTQTEAIAKIEELLVYLRNNM